MSHPPLEPRSPWPVAALLLLLLLLMGMFPHPAAGQSQNNFNPRDEEYRLLGLIRAKSEFEQAMRDFARSQRLFDESLLPGNELERARTRMENTRVDYLQASLAVIFEQPYVLIDRAVKLQGEDGEKYVRITLRNTAGSNSESESLRNLIDEEVLGQLQPEKVRSVFVSLKAEPGTGGAIVSSPYEHRIQELGFNEPVTITFRLLQDRDEVTVSVSYANRLDEKVVYLEKDATANIVSMDSTQFSQEADLGGQAQYDLALEQFTDEANTFRLAALGLPRDVRHEFRDPVSGARLTQVRFPMGVSQRNLTLTLYLPQRAGGSLPIEALDRPLDFYALVMQQEAFDELEQQFPEERRNDPVALDDAMQELDSGMVALELIPRGVGRVEIQAPNLYHEVDPGESVEMTVTLRNTGSRQLESLRLMTETQMGWRGKVVPDLIPSLPVNGETSVQLSVEPPPDVAVGDYQMRLRADSAAADRRVESQETSVRIHVNAGSNPWLTGSLATLLLGLVGGIVVFGVRLTRT